MLVYYTIGIITVAVFISVVLSVFLQRRERRVANRRQQQNRSNRTSSSFLGVFRRGPSLRQKMRAWLRKNIEDEYVKDWFENLSDKQYKRVYKELLTVFERMDVEVDWLVDNHLNRDADLFDKTAEAILLEVQARYQAQIVKQDVPVFAAYMEIIEGKVDADILKSLYKLLVEKEIVPPTPPEMSLVSPQEGQQYVLDQIVEASEKEWEQFSEVLQSVVPPQPVKRGFFSNLFGGNQDVEFVIPPAPTTAPTPATANAR